MRYSRGRNAPIRLALCASAVLLTAAAVQSCSRHSIRLASTATVPREGALEPEGADAPRPANPPHKVFISPEAPLTPEAQLATFSLPPGFEIQLVASEPEIQKPMQLAFDERGRLLASCSRDYPLGPAEGQAPGDSVFLIEVDGETYWIPACAGMTVQEQCATQNVFCQVVCA